MNVHLQMQGWVSNPSEEEEEELEREETIKDLYASFFYSSSC